MTTIEGALVNDAAPTIIDRLRIIASPPAAQREQQETTRLNAMRARLDPPLADARALVKRIEAQREESGVFIESVVALNFNDLRRTIPITVRGEMDSRQLVTLLERAARAADAALGASNARAVEMLIDRIDMFFPLDPQRSIELLADLDQLVTTARATAQSAQAHVKNTRSLLARLEADLAAGAGSPQQPEPPVEKITLPMLPELKEPAARAITEFDPMNYERAEAPKEDIVAGPYFKVPAKKEGRR